MNLKFFTSPLTLSCVLVALVLSPILWSGLYSDDLLNFECFKCGGDSFHQSFVVTCSDIIDSLKGGRLTPLTFPFMHFIYFCSPSVLQFKILLYLIDLLAVFSFSCFLINIGLREWIPMAFIFYVGLIQFYINYHDPFSSLHAMYPFLTILLMWTMITFNLFLKTQRSYLYIISLILISITILYSESGIIIFPLLLILLFWNEKSISQRFKIFLPIAILAFLYVCATLVVRHREDFGYYGMKTNFDIKKMSFVFLTQTLAALPLNALSFMSAIPSSLGESFIIVWPLILTIVLVFALLFVYVRRAILLPLNKERSWYVLFIGLTLWLIPPILIMMSKKYQDEMNYGRGYLPVFIEDFGIVLLMILILNALLKSWPASSIRIKGVASLLFFLFTLISTLVNECKILKVNRSSFIPEAIVYRELKKGLLNVCESGSTIALDSSLISNNDIGRFPRVIHCIYSDNLHVVVGADFIHLSPNNGHPVFVVESTDNKRGIIFSRMDADGSKRLIKSTEGSYGRDFDYFDLISMHW